MYHGLGVEISEVKVELMRIAWSDCFSGNQLQDGKIYHSAALFLVGVLKERIQQGTRNQYMFAHRLKRFIRITSFQRDQQWLMRHQHA
jgi:hypothetical protein